MKWDTIQQVLRIGMQAGGGIWLGTEIVDGEMFQAAIAGAMQLAAFLWWALWERERPSS